MIYRIQKTKKKQKSKPNLNWQQCSNSAIGNHISNYSQNNVSSVWIKQSYKRHDDSNETDPDSLAIRCEASTATFEQPTLRRVSTTPVYTRQGNDINKYNSTTMYSARTCIQRVGGWSCRAFDVAASAWTVRFLRSRTNKQTNETTRHDWFTLLLQANRPTKGTNLRIGIGIFEIRIEFRRFLNLNVSINRVECSWRLLVELRCQTIGAMLSLQHRMRSETARVISAMQSMKQKPLQNERIVWNNGWLEQRSLWQVVCMFANRPLSSSCAENVASRVLQTSKNSNKYSKKQQQQQLYIYIYI